MDDQTDDLIKSLFGEDTQVIRLDGEAPREDGLQGIAEILAAAAICRSVGSAFEQVFAASELLEAVLLAMEEAEPEKRQRIAGSIGLDLREARNATIAILRCLEKQLMMVAPGIGDPPEMLQEYVQTIRSMRTRRAELGRKTTELA